MRPPPPPDTFDCAPRANTRETPQSRVQDFLDQALPRALRAAANREGAGSPRSRSSGILMCRKLSEEWVRQLPGFSPLAGPVFVGVGADIPIGTLTTKGEWGVTLKVRTITLESSAMRPEDITIHIEHSRNPVVIRLIHPPAAANP